MNLLKNIICQSDNFWASRRSTISWGLKWPGSWLDTRKSQTIQRSDLQQSWCVEISWVRVESNPCRRKRGNRGRMTDNEPEWAPPEFGKPQPGRDSRSASAASSGKQHRRFRKTGFGWGEKFGLDEQDSQATLRPFWILFIAEFVTTLITTSVWQSLGIYASCWLRMSSLPGLTQQREGVLGRCGLTIYKTEVDFHGSDSCWNDVQ